MITHVVMFRWKAEITDVDRAAITAALDTLPAQVPSIRTYAHGPDVGASTAANFDYVIVATFDDVDGWREYDTNPVHEAVRAEVVRPWVEDRAAVQFGS